jgi:hypothetical protein
MDENKKEHICPVCNQREIYTWSLNKKICLRCLEEALVLNMNYIVVKGLTFEALKW